MASNVERYWQQFISSLPADLAAPDRFVEAFLFGSSPESARQISRLVVAGVKTATGSLLWAYEADGKPVPRTGDRCVVMNGGDDPVCVIETVDVQVIPYDEVGEEYAWEGGEEDRSLVSWRRIYWEYIVAECRRIGREPAVDVPLVMERFRVLYRQALRDA